MQEQLAYSIPHFMDVADIKSRSTVYKEIAEGRLQTVKVGRRRLIPVDAAREWLEQLRGEAA